MPHKCARCEKVYADNAPELISGCVCGAKVFLFMKKRDDASDADAVEDLKKKKLVPEDLDWIESRLSKGGRGGGDKTLHLDIENLLRVSKGKYRINISSLMKGDPLVIKVRDGVYYIDIPYAMKPKGK
jgi:hypothetical protein